MFSFFKTKKPSPPSSPESDPIPSAGSDFVIVNQRQGGSDPNPYLPYSSPYPYPNPNPNPLYPNFNQNFGNPSGVPPIPIRPPLQHSDSVHPTNYVNDIPFKLSPELSMGNSDEILRIQLDDILSLITSKMAITEIDYDFTLERSLLQQSEPDTIDSNDAAKEDEEE